MTKKYYVYRVRLAKVADTFYFLGTGLVDCVAEVERWLREPCNAGRSVDAIEIVGPLTAAPAGSLNPDVPGSVVEK